MNDKEKLIEEAAKAIYEAQVEEATCGDLARAALAVFEKAHTPTDETTHRGTFGHVWPCPLFYVGNWRRGERGYEPVRDCTSAAVCAPIESQREPSDAEDIIVQEVSRLAGMQLLRRYSSFSDAWWDELHAGIARVVRAAGGVR